MTWLWVALYLLGLFWVWSFCAAAARGDRMTELALARHHAERKQPW